MQATKREGAALTSNISVGEINSHKCHSEMQSVHVKQKIAAFNESNKSCILSPTQSH
jgi:hypothetical protein